MVWNPFKIVSKNCLGIDVGTSSIKVVEISSSRRRKKLENYGELGTEDFSQKPFRTVHQNSCLLSSEDIADVISAILEETKTRTRKAVFSIPDFSSFFTWFKLPQMTKEELSEAVKYEARQHIPFPLSEVVLDWQIIKSGPSLQDKKKKKGAQGKKDLKILLVSVPKEVISQYREIASLAKLELLAIEAEVFALSRSLIKNNNLNTQSRAETILAIMDIGAQSTTVSVIDHGILERSHSFDIAGNELTEVLAKSFQVDYKKGEEIKQKYGLLEKNFENGKNAREILVPLIDLILTEIKKVCKSFYQTEEKKIQKIIIAGGAALIPGLGPYFSNSLKIPVEIADPFSNIFYPPILENQLKKMGSLYAVAVGVGLRGIE